MSRQHHVNNEEGNVGYIMGGGIAVLLAMGVLSSTQDKVQHSLNTRSVPADVKKTGIPSSLEQPTVEGEK